MRGFRGSRNAQNAINARFGRQENPNHFRNGQGNQPHGHANPQQRPALPDWLKTPETKAREQQGDLPKPALLLPIVQKAAPQATAVVKIEQKQDKAPAARKAASSRRKKTASTASARPVARKAAAPRRRKAAA